MIILILFNINIKNHRRYKMENDTMVRAATETNLTIKRQRGLKTVARWGKITGIMIMITGSISALIGLLSFIIGAIPGAILTWTGFLIIKSAKSADNLTYEWNEEELDNLIESYGKFLMINGVLIIISIVVGVLSMGAIMTILANFV